MWLRGGWVGRLSRRLLKSERGQALIFFVGTLSVIMAIAALAVDVGLWHRDRGVARNAAGAAARAGAASYDPLDRARTLPAAEAAAQAWAASNVNGVATVSQVDCTVLGSGSYPSDGFKVDVTHQSSALFAKTLQISPPLTKATATACVASAEQLSGLRPLAVSLQEDDVLNGNPSGCLAGSTPRFGVPCTLYLRSPGTGAGWERLVDLDDANQCSGSPVPGSLGDIDRNIERGGGYPCSVGEPLFQEVVNPGPPGQRLDDAIRNAQRGLQGLMGQDDCDDQPFGDGDDIEDFEEVVIAPDGLALTIAASGGLFLRQDCDAEPLIHLPVVDSFPSGSSGEAIEAFMPFFVVGCVYQPGGTGPFVSDPDCDGQAAPNPDFDPGADPFGVVGRPIKLQELIEHPDIDGRVVRFDGFGTRRIFLSE